MKILALESSAIAASVALCDGEKLVAQCYQNNGLTHSRTLMSMTANLLENCGVALDAIDLIAVGVGPGSFTGLRIGVAAAKGLAWAKNLPCAPCSTLESMAWTATWAQSEICAVMDARRSQVYNARFVHNAGTLTRLTPDRAIGLDDLCHELKDTKKVQILVGDGANLCYNEFVKRGIPARLPPPHLHHQQAWGVARCALDMAQSGALVSEGDLVPVYLRLSQAERERLEKATTP